MRIAPPDGIELPVAVLAQDYFATWRDPNTTSGLVEDSSLPRLFSGRIIRHGLENEATIAAVFFWRVRRIQVPAQCR